MEISSNADKYTILRKRFQAFYYDGYEFNRKKDHIAVMFRFRLDDAYTFRPEMKIKLLKGMETSHISDEHLEYLIFNIGMVELISYWKAACPAVLIIRPYFLSDKQISFWKKMYFNGLGEFFYRNDIRTTQDDFMAVICEASRATEKLRFHTTRDFVVPVGGGKDSVVTLQLLNEFTNNERQIQPFIMNPRGASMETVLRAGYDKKDIFIIERSIDGELLKMNAEGFLNGHTPFSALLAFNTLLVSAFTRNRYIALSNESSANEATVPGTNINHQYSKSKEFEDDFRDYVKEYISDDFEYFSFLRPLTEFQIAKIFSLYNNYFSSFKSCNVGSSENKWCGKCPKCLFTYIILSPFLSPEEMISIFGSDLLDDKDQMKNYLDLSGQSDIKPFECVGTYEEVNIALAITASRYRDGQKMPELLLHYMQTSLYRKYSEVRIADQVLSGLHKHNLPKELAQKLAQYMLKVFCR